MRLLYENDNVSRSELDVSRAQAESTAAFADAVLGRVNQARQRLRYTRLEAPVSGAIAEVRADEGENAASGQTIVVLTSGSRPEVRVPVPEILIGRINAGDAVRVSFDALPGRAFSAVVTEVGVASTAGTTYPVEVRLAESDEAIRPGMAAQVAFTFRGRGDRSTYLLPPVAVGEDREGRFVFVVSPGEAGLAVARRRAVVVGDLTSEGLEVLEGVEEGETIVTAGVRRIVDGLTVRLPHVGAR